MEAEVDWGEVDRVARVLAADAMKAVGYGRHAMRIRALRPVTSKADALAMTRVALEVVEELRAPMHARVQKIAMVAFYAAIAAWRGYPNALQRHLADLERIAARMTAPVVLQEVAS